ncbi:MAG: hypothetical protein H0Z37_07775 [Firmicutes bacterium]|nr:hypothetical protein [Bacillota bacterium]
MVRPRGPVGGAASPRVQTRRQGVVATSLFLAFLLGVAVVLIVLAAMDIEWPPRRRRPLRPPFR